MSVPDLVLVTGMSGAGRSSVLAVLEDLGFEAIDNLPIGLLDRLAAPMEGEAPGGARAPFAVGVDVRTRDFDPDQLTRTALRLGAEGGRRVVTVFLDCEDEQLMRRFAETRRRHPLAADRPVADGIALERRTLAPLLERADLRLDTSDLTPWMLKERVRGLFAPEGGHGSTAGGPTVTVMSFAFRHGLPREADMVVDARFLSNPHYDPVLRPLTGLDGAVGTHIETDPDFHGFLDDLSALLRRTLPRYEQEGKAYLTIAIGCTGGRHRSVYTAECLARRLEAAGWSIARFHRDLERAEENGDDRRGGASSGGEAPRREADDGPSAPGGPGNSKERAL
ncbi:RNase adapter RapZ [Marivibrio halodurans]